jgi:hypothetical protein
VFCYQTFYTARRAAKPPQTLVAFSLFSVQIRRFLALFQFNLVSGGLPLCPNTAKTPVFRPFYYYCTFAIKWP